MPDAPHIHPIRFLNETARYRTDWNGVALRGHYLIETRRKSNPPGDSVPVVLIPGGFDPVRGSYGDAFIEGLLAHPRISAVYEAHYEHQGRGGYVDIASIVHDLRLMLTDSAQRPLLVAMSLSTFSLSCALHATLAAGEPPAATGIVLIGPYLAGYETLLARALEPYYRREKMRERIFKHCGHPYLFDNSDRLLTWWDQHPPFRRFLQEGDFADFAQRQTLSMNLVYFRLDTLSRRGRRLFKQAFNGQPHAEVIPGHHRALRYLAAADPILLRACETHLRGRPAAAPAARILPAGD
ncbi:MAG TPA: hypothetical protein PKE41_05200 [Candidatus Macondimonas sp.]|nr:hypothetical protein [Candidatus Macondimonas sp.]